MLFILFPFPIIPNHITHVTFFTSVQRADCSMDTPRVCTYQFFSCTKSSKRKGSKTSFSVLINRFARAYFHLTIHYFTKTGRNTNGRNTFQSSDPLSNLVQNSQSPTIKMNKYRKWRLQSSCIPLHYLREKKKKKSKNGSKHLSFFFHDIQLKAQSALNAHKFEEHGRKLHGDETAHTTCSSKKL